MPQNMDRDPDVPRDSQQIQDDNQSSGESVVGGQTSGDAQQPTGVGSRQENLPPRGEAKDDGHA